MLTKSELKAKRQLRHTIVEMEKEVKKSRIETGLITNPHIKALEERIEILTQALRLIK